MEGSGRTVAGYPRVGPSPGELSRAPMGILEGWTVPWGSGPTGGEAEGAALAPKQPRRKSRKKMGRKGCMAQSTL